MIDVLVVGAGPTGCLLTALLGGFGLSVTLVEKQTSVCQEPRAISIDDEGLLALQLANVELNFDSVNDTGLIYVGVNGRPFAQVAPSQRIYGFARRSAVHQPDVVSAICKSAQKHKHVEMFWSTEVIKIELLSDVVIATLQAADRSKKMLRSRFAILAEGGQFADRLELPRIETKFDERWLVLDLIAYRNRQKDTIVYCNPDRPAITLVGPNNRRRWEFRLSKHEDGNELPEDIATMLHKFADSNDLSIIRKTVYRFRAMIRKQWMFKTMFLAGDSARKMPPFAGQGMNSGLRDAVNLAWKIWAVRSGVVGSELLASYQEEREFHSWKMLNYSLRLGAIMRPSSYLSAIVVQSLFRTLNRFPSASKFIREMQYKPIPRFRSGWFWRDYTWPGSLGGQLLPDFEVFHCGKRLSIFNLLPKGFVLIGVEVAEPTLNDLNSLGLRVSYLSITKFRGTKRGHMDNTFIAENTHEFVHSGYFLLRPDRVIAGFCISFFELLEHVQNLPGIQRRVARGCG